MLSSLHSQLLFAGRKKAKPTDSAVPAQGPVNALQVRSHEALEDSFMYSAVRHNAYADAIDPSGKRFNLRTEKHILASMAKVKSLNLPSRNERTYQLGELFSDDLPSLIHFNAVSMNHSKDAKASLVLFVPRPDTPFSKDAQKTYRRILGNQNIESKDWEKLMGEADSEDSETNSKYMQTLNLLQQSFKDHWLNAELPEGCWLVDVDHLDRVYCTSDPDSMAQLRKKHRAHTKDSEAKFRASQKSGNSDSESAASEAINTPQSSATT